MEPYKHRPTATCACLFLALSTMARGHEPVTNTFQMNYRQPAVDFYAYVGAERLDLEESGSSWRYPVELRAVTPHDWAFSIDSSVDDDLDVGNTTLRVAKGFRTIPGIDFLTLEYGEVLSDPGLGEIERSLEVRAQGGYTRFGIDVSVEYLDIEGGTNLGDGAYTATVGYRGQFGRTHVGLDYMATQFRNSEAENLNSLSLVAMQRTYRGDSIYGFIEKGLSDENDGWYIGVGYDYKLPF